MHSRLFELGDYSLSKKILKRQINSIILRKKIYILDDETSEEIVSVNQLAEFKNNFKNFLYIDRVALSVEFQRKGYGTELYNEIYKISNNSEYPLCCEVNTIPLNKQSLDFHHKFGFQTLKKVPFGEKQVAMLCKH